MLISVFVASQVFANNIESLPLATLANKPTIYLSMVKKEGNTLISLNSTTYSVSQKDVQLCWEVVNLPLNAANRVEETFRSPTKAQILPEKNAMLEVSNGGKTHKITSFLPTAKKNFIRRCWLFDHRDPVGEYKVDVKIGNLLFPTQTFTVVK